MALRKHALMTSSAAIALGLLALAGCEPQNDGVDDTDDMGTQRDTPGTTDNVPTDRGTGETTDPTRDPNQPISPPPGN